MSKRSIELAALAIALTFAGACKGRTAAWEDKSETPEPKAKTGETTKADGAEMSGNLAAGMPAWELRGQGKDKTLEAIAAWEQAFGCSEGTTKPEERCSKVDTSAENIEALAMLTRAHYFYADSFMRDNEEAYLDYMDRGVWWGERALIAASPEFAEKMRNKGKYYEAITVVGIEGLPAMYWYATALGKWARASGFGVLVGQKDNIKATMTRALELDPNFYHGGPHRYFGAFYAIAPAFAGGDLEKSRKHYEESLSIAPYYIGTKVLMAENLATKLDDEEMFDRLLNEVIEADISTAPAEIHAEMTVEKQKAQELLKKKEEEDWF
jgi:hypothetical protein